MLTLITLALAATLIPLAAVLLYVLVNGLPGLTLTLFTRLPRPVDVGAGGMANSMLGSLVIVGIAAVLGTVIGIAGGIYLAEYGQGTLAWLVRFLADVLSGVPSITIGLFVYVLLVVPVHSFNALAGAVALAIIMLPLVVRTTEEMLRLVPGSAAGGRTRPGGAALARRPPGALAGGSGRDRHWYAAGGGPHRWRNGAAALHGFRQRILATVPAQAGRCRAAARLQVRDRPL